MKRILLATLHCFSIRPQQIGTAVFACEKTDRCRNRPVKTDHGGIVAAWLNPEHLMSSGQWAILTPT